MLVFLWVCVFLFLSLSPVLFTCSTKSSVFWPKMRFIVAQNGNKRKWECENTRYFKNHHAKFTLYAHTHNVMITTRQTIFKRTSSFWKIWILYERQKSKQFKHRERHRQCCFKVNVLPEKKVLFVYKVYVLCVYICIL